MSHYRTAFKLVLDIFQTLETSYQAENLKQL